MHEATRALPKMDISPPITHLVMIGACYIDTILSVPIYPQEDEKIRATSLAKRRGGNVANSLEVLQQLVRIPSERSFCLHLLCVLPSATSLATKFIRESFDSNVDISLCVHRESHTEAASSYVIRGVARGSRTIVNYNDLPEMTLGEFQAQVQKSHDKGIQRTWYHFEGRIPATSVACMRWLRNKYPDVLISVEAEKPSREGLGEMAGEADVVFYAKGWAVAEGYQDAEEFLKDQAAKLKRARLLCCTWGAEGAAIMRPDDRFCYHEPAHVDIERQVVDTIGAGDTFVAGMLYWLLVHENVDAKDALQFANKLAGRKVLQDGFADLA